LSRGSLTLAASCPLASPAFCFEVCSLTERRKSVATRLWISSCLGSVVLCMLLGLACAQSTPPSRQSLEKLVDIGPTGIGIKRPVFAGACKACPWGILAFITQAALKPYGYDVKICWVCWSSFGPRQMADKTKPTLPPGAARYYRERGYLK
jgi:hypothetical protein